MSKLMRITIPGARSAGTDSGSDLIDEFLWATDGLDDREIAETAGVSVATIQRWRRSGSHRLRGDIRRRLERYVRRTERARARKLQAA